MSEDEFRAFYAENARRLWAFAARVSGDRSVADDVAQESFLRLLEVEGLDAMTPAHRKNYLFRIAANLLKRRFRHSPPEEASDLPAPEAEADVEEIVAVRNALRAMKPAERTLLWLAYVEGFSHREISTAGGYREQSVRPLLHRARQKLAALLGRKEPA